jgi:ABC-2 type transport system permease protein
MKDALRVTRYDYLIAVREGRFWAALALTAVLAVFCIASTRKAYQVQTAQQRAAAEETHQQFLDQGDKNPHTAAHYGMYAFKPISLLSLIDPGVLPYTGVAIFMEPHRQNTALFRPAEDSSSSARFSSLSISTLMLVFVPFLIVAMLYDSVAGDFTNGSLRQLLATGISKRSFAFGKLLGAMAKISSVILPAGLLVGAILAFTDTQSFGSSALRLLLLCLAYFLYCCLWIMLTISVSALAKQPGRAIGALLLVWLLATLVIPPGAAELVRSLRPTPSRLAFEKAVAKDLQTPPRYEDEIKREALGEYHVSRVEDLPVSWAGVLLEKNENHTTHVYRSHMELLQSDYESQTRLASLLGIFDPLLNVKELSAALTGTSVRDFDEFTSSADRYRESFVQAMNDDMKEHGTAAGYVATRSTFETVPKFNATLPTLSDTLRSQSIGIVLLLVQLLLGAALFLFSMRRLEVL